jgi:zinc protease
MILNRCKMIIRKKVALRLFACAVALVAATATVSPSASANAAGDALASPRTMSFAALKFQIPKSERVQLENGMIVYLLQDHELPLVKLTAYLNAGGIYDPADKVGLAGLAGDTMRSGGTLNTPPELLDRKLEFMASAIEADINADHATVSMSTLTRNLAPTMELFAEVVTKPAFNPARVDLARNNAIEAIRRENDDPKAVGDRELTRAIYQGHPLGRIPSTESVQGITREDLVSFHKRYFYPANTIVAVSGDFDRNTMLESLGKLFADWRNHPAQIPAIPQPRDDHKAEVLHVQKQVNQSVIRMGHLGIDKNNPDLYAIKVMDYILGGGFTSRLTQEIRSNQGLAYNVDSYFETGRRFPGPFVAETETKSETTARTISLLRSIITGMTEREVSDRELKLAKDAIINSFIFSFERSDSVVTQQARLEFYHYPKGYLENFRDNIAKVTKADVLRVAKQYLEPDAMKLVVVGDEKKFDKPLSEFGKVREIKLNNH